MNVLRKRKLVIIGDDGSGKTSLVRSLVTGKFDETSIPSVYDLTTVNIDVDMGPKSSGNAELALWDTAEGKDYDVLRPVTYPDAGILVLCFSIDNVYSLEKLHEKWLQEIRHYCQGVPFLLVGTKADLRSSPSSSPNHLVTTAQGRDAAHKLGANGYMECSAKTGDGVRQVFEQATRIALRTTGDCSCGYVQNRHRCIVS